MILAVTVILKLCNNDLSSTCKIGIVLPLMLDTISYAKYYEFLIICIIILLLKTKALEKRFLPSWPKTHQDSHDSELRGQEEAAVRDE